MADLAFLRRPDSEDLAAFLQTMEAAQKEFAQGRAADFKALWSQTDDVTLSGGNGGVIERGWDAVAARLDWASSTYQEGDRSYQTISGHVGEDFAYVVRKEVIEARIGDQAGRSRMELRVTMIFRRAGDGWRIVHRHADSQTAISVVC
jgi:ketosteroid isomerase-like protein